MKNSSCFSLTLTSYLFQEVFLKRKKAAVLCHKFALICIFETEFKVCLSVKCPKYKLHFGNSCISLLRQIIAHFIKIRIRNNTRRTLQSVVSVVAKYWKMQEQELLQSVMVLLRSATEHARLSFITLCIN